jgi:hypothetical protein
MEFVWYFVLAKWWDRKISFVNSIPMKILRKPYNPKEPLLLFSNFYLYSNLATLVAHITRYQYFYCLVCPNQQNFITVSKRLFSDLVRKNRSSILQRF